MEILKFWRTELSYAQNKNRDEKVHLLGIDNGPSLNEIMKIRCIKHTRKSSCTIFKLSDFLALWMIRV